MQIRAALPAQASDIIFNLPLQGMKVAVIATTTLVVFLTTRYTLSDTVNGGKNQSSGPSHFLFISSCHSTTRCHTMSLVFLEYTTTTLGRAIQVVLSNR